jgi:hypothetical protein
MCTAFPGGASVAASIPAKLTAKEVREAREAIVTCLEVLMGDWSDQSTAGDAGRAAVPDPDQIVSNRLLLVHSVAYTCA